MKKLSIIIPTFCRPNLLRLGLYSLQKQTLNFSYEIIILNDGEENDGTKEVIEEFSHTLNIKYIVCRQKDDPIDFRIPGFALNIGVAHATGRHLIIMSPEIFILDDKITEMMRILDKNPSLMVIPEGLNDSSGECLQLVEQTKQITGDQFAQFAQTCTKLNTELPFFMAINRQKYLDIGGYDENFVGYCFDDNDFVCRLQDIGCQYYHVDMRVVHLYHSRKREGLKGKRSLYTQNQKLFNHKRNDKQNIQSTSIKAWELHKIPKIAHFYWGEKTLPYMRFLTIYTFLKHNPDWEIRYYYPKFRYPEKTWTTFELKYDISKAKDYITELRELPVQMIELDFSQYLLPNDISEVFKSDLLRWSLLSTTGGLWSDMDILYFRPMTTLLNNTKENSEVDTGITINDTYGHSIGFLLSAPNNLYYDHIIKHTSSYFNPKNYQCLGTTMLIKEVRTMSIIAEKFPTLTIANIDNNAVYAYNASMIKSIYNSESLTHFTPHSIGLHWYAGHPLSGEFLNVVTEENYLEYTNVIGSVLNFSLNQTECGINLLLNKGIK